MNTISIVVRPNAYRSLSADGKEFSGSTSFCSDKYSEAKVAVRIHIDFSIFTQEPSAFGGANGFVDLAVVPVIGDDVWFLCAKPSAEMPAAVFSGRLRVEHRSLFVNEHDNRVMVTLGDLIVPTASDARAVADYLEKGFGLFIDVYGDEADHLVQ